MRGRTTLQTLSKAKFFQDFLRTKTLRVTIFPCWTHSTGIFFFSLGNFLTLLTYKIQLFLFYHSLIKSSVTLKVMRGLIREYTLTRPSNQIKLFLSACHPGKALAESCVMFILFQYFGLFFVLVCYRYSILIIFSGQVREKKMGTLRKFSQCPFLRQLTSFSQNN